MSARNQIGYTPLHLAALQGHMAACQLLLKHEANANARDNKGSRDSGRFVVDWVNRLLSIAFSSMERPRQHRPITSHGQYRDDTC